MSYNLGKRLSDLKKQTDENLSARWHIGRTAFLTFLGLVAARYLIFPLVETPTYQQAVKIQNTPEDAEAESEKDLWIQDTQALVSERIAWLSNSPIVLMPGTDQIYENIARHLDQTFDLSPNKSKNEEVDFFFTFSDIPIWWSRMVAGSTLRLTFVILAFWPLWIIGLLSGYFFMKFSNKKKLSPTILGVCDRNVSPYYSGIYGPYKPNHSFSATEISCPGLACPKMADKSVVEKHGLVSLLKRHKAYSETNFELLRIILEHSNYPHFVEEENPIIAEEPDGPIELENRISKTGYVDNEKGTLIDGVSLSLPALLEAHTATLRYIDTLKRNKISLADLEKNYPNHLASLQKSCSSISKLAQYLVSSLTPSRLWAIASLPASVVASAYLSTEAGKVLVYKRSGNGFTVTSLYPHLQARAIIQSIVPYHQETNGDTRLIIRQALISSRRHGDFGRSFLPIRMPIESRALRDWLETLYSENEKRQEISQLVELDGHMEEIHNNFRSRFIQRTRTSHKEDAISRNHELWKGLVFKSVGPPSIR